MTKDVFYPAPTVRSAYHEDGVILMDIGRGKYFAINSTGAQFWKAVEGGTPLAGGEEGESEGAQAFATELLDKGLLSRSPAGAEPLPERSWEAGPDRASHGEPSTPEGTATHRSPWQFVGGWLTLVAVDLVLRGLSFRHLHGLVRRWPVRRWLPFRGGASHLCQNLDRAALYYFRRAWCLQRSAAAVILLRSMGLDANLVFGVRPVPFAAHAWAEVGGTVVNDRPRVQRYYLELERC